MSSQLYRASTIAIAATVIAAFASAVVSGAAAHEPASPALQAASSLPFVAEPLVQPLSDQSAPTAGPEALAEDTAPVSASSLAELVSAQPRPAELSRELNCMAGAIYFEAKSESLPGQLAVGRVIVARSKSGRFPNSYCGVVFQPSQFSFVRGGGMPGIDHRSPQWRSAVAIAQIAHAGAWRSPAEGALYFHAARVSPAWHKTRIAQVDHHVFYR